MSDRTDPQAVTLGDVRQAVLALIKDATKRGDATDVRNLASAYEILRQWPS